jgi:hypothetical protein
MPAAAAAKPCFNSTPPLSLLTTQLAGFQYYAGKQIWNELRDEDELTLRREPDNRYDSRAVEINWRDYKLGYIPRRDNTVIAQLMDRKVPLRVTIIQLDEGLDPRSRLCGTSSMKMNRPILVRDDEEPWRRIHFSIEVAV